MYRKVSYTIATVALTIAVFFYWVGSTVPELAFADDTGAVSVGTTAASTGTCSDNMNFTGHGTPGNAGADDTTYLTYTGNNFDSGEISDGIYASNFGFTTSGTIDGIQVEVLNWTTQNTAQYEDVVLGTSLGTRVGDDKEDSTVLIDSSDTGSYDSWGGASDTWNASLTSAQVNASTFGVEFCYQAQANETQIAIDHIRVTVTYTPAVGGTTKQQSVIWFD
jgi:hypothetical protein